MSGKYFKFLLIPALVVGLSASTQLAAQGDANNKQQSGKQDTQTEKEAKLIAAAKKAYAEIGDLIKQDKWGDIEKRMTKKGASSFCASQVEALTMSGDFPVPELEAPLKELKKLVEKYELQDNVKKLRAAVMELRKAPPQPGAFEKTMLAAIDKDGKRWEIASAIWKAQRGFPFRMDPLTGKVKNVSVEGDTVILEVELSMTADDGAVPEPGRPQMIEIIAPPLAIRMKKSGENWLYAGVDDKKSRALAEKMMPPFGAGGPGIGDPGIGGPGIGGPGTGGPGMGGAIGIMNEGPSIIADPDFSGKSVDGKAIKLADYRGKIVLVDFWGTWCAGCIAEFPALKLIREKFKQHGFEIVGVALDDTKPLQEFLDKKKLSWPNVVDSKGAISRKFGIQSFPTTLLIDKKGNHVASNLSKSKLVDELIKRLELDPGDFAKLKKQLVEEEKKGQIEMRKKMEKMMREGGGIRIGPGKPPKQRKKDDFETPFKKPMAFQANGKSVIWKDYGFTSPTIGDFDADGNLDLVVGWYSYDKKSSAAKQKGEIYFDTGNEKGRSFQDPLPITIGDSDEIWDTY